MSKKIVGKSATIIENKTDRNYVIATLHERFYLEPGELEKKLDGHIIACVKAMAATSRRRQYFAFPEDGYTILLICADTRIAEFFCYLSLEPPFDPEREEYIQSTVAL
ncbi:MAG TPA: hypothetical protein VHC69_13180 [Polyangiaceae bacterium]|nr:hypothetical protein [Polyangiaceae bacterium]